MQETTIARPKSRRQRLGRRLGRATYYRVTEQGPTRLVLDSRPEVLIPVVSSMVLASIVFGLPGFLLLAGGILNTPRLGAGALLLMLPGLALCTLGLGLLTAGRTLLRVRNSIILDTADQTVVYRQRLERSAKKNSTQTLPFDQVAGVTLSGRLVKTLPLRPPQALAVVEFVTVSGRRWIVDSAADPAVVRPLAQAVATMLGQPLDDTTIR